MLSKNAELLRDSESKHINYPMTYKQGFNHGYFVAQDESRAEIEKLRAALIRITKNVSKSGQDEVFYAIANEALQKDDEGEK